MKPWELPPRVSRRSSGRLVLLEFPVNNSCPPPPHFFAELRILKELGEKILELRIPKDLAAILDGTEIDCKGVSEDREDKFLDLRILKELGGW